MADRPIIFSGKMVRAILDGRKTQTRRVVKDVPDMPAPDCHPSHTPKHPAPYLDAYCGEQKTSANPRGMGRNWHWWQVDDRPGVVAFRLPYAPGDRLWVRESWNMSGLGWNRPQAGLGKLHYRATDEGQWKNYWGAWRSPIHMPRWASRLTLTVTNVRVQRLQDISEDDARAEGVLWVPGHGEIAPADLHEGYSNYLNCREGFQVLWNSLNAARGYGWDANPWVCAVTFETHQNNIDQMEAPDA